MPIAKNLLEVSEYSGEGYLPLVDFDTWRVAVLNFIDELLPERLNIMQRHDETDEVFVLLKGRCILFLGSEDQAVIKIYAEDLRPLKFYNVKKGCWHTHTLSEDASVLIVENLDTTSENSPTIALSAPQRRELVNLTHQLWQE
ncbi:MAG: hypothetical protein ABSE06_00200 [Anaerolineaceae bacterium]|jgi:hypothetical protein